MRPGPGATPHLIAPADRPGSAVDLGCRGESLSSPVKRVRLPGHCGLPAATAAHLVDQWVAADNTVVVGGDVNLDVRQRGNTDVSNGLRPWYHGPFGAGITRCCAGSGSMYEVDRYRVCGDGTYDEATYGAAKIDVVFGDRWHVHNSYRGDATGTSFSDHDVLRGAMTAHDWTRLDTTRIGSTVQPMSVPSHHESTPAGRSP